MQTRSQGAAAPVVSLALQQALQSSDSLLERLPIGVCSCDAAGVVVQYNRRAAELWGREPPPEDASFCGSLKLFDLAGEPIAEPPMAELLRTGEPIRDREVMIERPDGTRIVVLANLDPLFDHAGGLIGGVNCFQDITELKRSQQRERESERRMRELLEALPAAIYTTDAEGRITFYNQAAVDLAGREPELGGDQWCVTWRLYHPDGTPLAHAECPMAQALKENRPIRGVEALAERPDGTLAPFLPFPTPLHDADGKLVGAVNMLVDISERKRADERQKVLIDELNHRVKNTLATVQSIAMQTLREAPSPETFAANFEARLIALAKAHDLLTRRQWQGADLADIVAQELAPFAEGAEGRVAIEGETITLEPRVALALSMAFHELATNAAKYGALSAPEGRVAIRWRVEPGEDDEPAAVALEWTEQDGPPVAPPERRGFGTRLVERSVARELGGQADLRFEPPGVRCEIRFPLQSGPADP